MKDELCCPYTLEYETCQINYQHMCNVNLFQRKKTADRKVDCSTVAANLCYKYRVQDSLTSTIQSP